jgi:3-isopropylmalate/(R)-2-methylmalate dehydratase large subunit
MTIIMGDSHTCTHGAFGAFAAGVGTTDLEVGILKGVCAFRRPVSIRIELTGKLPPGVYAKDVILQLIGRLGVDGATDRILEFRGPVVGALSMDARMTLCNMAVEAGATCGICPPDGTTLEYLWPFITDQYARRDAALADFRRWQSDPDAVYERVVELDVGGLEPTVTWGFKPDQVRSVGEMAGTPVDQVYIGTCTNGRLEDLRAAADILRGRRVADTVRGIVSPATPGIYRRALDEGIIAVFMDAGFCVTNPTCGACLGMSNGVLAEGEVCAATSNRNFPGRMGRGGMVHLMSPATAAATALTGRLTDPRVFLPTAEGRKK